MTLITSTRRPSPCKQPKGNINPKQQEEEEEAEKSFTDSDFSDQ